MCAANSRPPDSLYRCTRCPARALGCASDHDMTLNDRLYRLLRLPLLSLPTIVILPPLSVIAVVIILGTWVWIGVTNDQYSQLDRRLDSVSSLGDVSTLLLSPRRSATDRPAPDDSLVRTVRVSNTTVSGPGDIVLPSLPVG